MSDARDRWERVSRILTDALEVPLPTRPGFLEAACGGDAVLRREVEDLLAAHEATGLFDGLVTDETVSLPPGTRLGPWAVDGLLGRGGMGAVYAAHRADGEFEQEVALKVLPEGLVSARLEARFRAERQILARLDHPNLARLVDGGVDDAGRPWFAMERIQGTPIVEYCDQEGLGIPARLHLLQAVCGAVAHAHRSLVIHRDIKPDNILVDERGTPRLLDFGIAKLLDPDALGADPLETQAGFHLLTPAYAAPEQLRGEPPTTATDIYQLGLLAYRLLAGAHPFPERTRRGAPTPGASPSTVGTSSAAPSHPRTGRAGRTDPDGPPRPSAAAPDTRRRGLRGDLDAIVLKALRPSPEDRYSSVDALVADLQRHRAHRPVHARAGGWVYRSRRFLRRNAAAVAGVILVLAGAGAFAAGAAREARETARERDRAEAMNRFLVGLFESASPYVADPGRLTVREMLDVGAKEVRTDRALDAATRANLLSVMADAYWTLGLFPDAVALAEDALALQSGPGSAGDGRPRLEDPGAAAEELRLTLAARLGRYLAGTGAVARSDRLLEEVEAALDRRGDLSPTTRSRLHNDLGLGWFMGGEGDRAAPHFQATIALSRERARVQTNAEANLATNLSNLARLEADRGHAERADTLFREALAIRERIFGPVHPRVAAALSGLGELYLDVGRPAAADSVLRRVLAIRQETLPPGHFEIAGARAGLAQAAGQLGRIQEADSLFRQAVRGLEASLGSDNAGVASVRNDWGLFLRNQGRIPEAIEQLSRSRAIYLDLFGPEHLSSAIPGASLAWAHYLHGDPLTAERLFGEVVPFLLAQDSLDPAHRVHQMEWGASLCALDRTRFPDAGDEAAHQMEAAIAALDQVPTAAGQALYSRNVLGDCLASQGRGPSAARWYREVLDRTRDWPEARPYAAYAEQQLAALPGG